MEAIQRRRSLPSPYMASLSATYCASCVSAAARMLPCSGTGVKNASASVRGWTSPASARTNHGRAYGAVEPSFAPGVTVVISISEPV